MAKLKRKDRQTTAIDFAHPNIIPVLALDGTIVYQSSRIGETLETIRQSTATFETAQNNE
ncbi:MAG: hypothetical protein P1U89_25770 [Verrucomicrobiales bacterium]|nr:hypothetical protein [Verrucomicrobiales bacterium]